MDRTIYMDYQATTPCDKRVLEQMLPYFCKKFGNPHSSSHSMGREAKLAVEHARQQIAKLINASDSESIVFTSGATESNNLALQGVVRFYGDRANRSKIIVSNIEHKCVLETCYTLAKDGGFELIYAPVEKNGLVDLNFLDEHIDEKTLLVSVMAVNNEIGTIQPIDAISAMCRQRGVLFHCDAAQAVGKIPVDASMVDLMSISGHKIYGPKGIGALYVRRKPRLRLSPIFYGGGQERGVRSGTLATPLCVGIGAACELAGKEMADENARLNRFKEFFITQIMQNLEKTYLNGDPDKRIPGCLNFSFEGVEGEAIMLGLPDLCISSGSACTSEILEPSYVLRAVSAREDLAHSSVRIGLGRFTTEEEVKYAVGRIIEVVTRLRSMSPLWR